MPQPVVAWDVLCVWCGWGDAGSGQRPINEDACWPRIRLIVYYRSQSPRCRQIHGNKAPYQITNIRFGLAKQNKAVCEWLGFSVNHHVIIILTYWHQLGGKSKSLPTPSQASLPFNLLHRKPELCFRHGCCQNGHHFLFVCPVLASENDRTV